MENSDIEDHDCCKEFEILKSTLKEVNLYFKTNTEICHTKTLVLHLVL